MPSTKLTSKGQLTVPIEIREHLGLHQGDRLEFRKDPDGRVWVEAATVDLFALRGFFGPATHRRSQEELDDAVRRGAAGESP